MKEIDEKTFSLFLMIKICRTCRFRVLQFLILIPSWFYLKGSIFFGVVQYPFSETLIDLFQWDSNRETKCDECQYVRTTDYQWNIFLSKPWTFGLGKTVWADKFWGICGIFSQTISTHFGTVSPLSIFSIIQPLFSQKTKPLYPHPNYLFGIGIWIWIQAVNN